MKTIKRLQNVKTRIKTKDSCIEWDFLMTLLSTLVKPPTSFYLNSTNSNFCLHLGFHI